MTSIDELLADQRLDVVALATPGLRVVRVLETLQQSLRESTRAARV